MGAAFGPLLDSVLSAPVLWRGGTSPFAPAKHLPSLTAFLPRPGGKSAADLTSAPDVFLAENFNVKFVPFFMA